MKYHIRYFHMGDQLKEKKLNTQVTGMLLRYITGTRTLLDIGISFCLTAVC